MSRYSGKYFSMARIADTVHSAVEMLCAPRALQIVTCGPTVRGIHSVPAIMASTSFTPRRRGHARIARRDTGRESRHRSLRRDPSCPTRDQLDSNGEIAKQLSRQCGWVSDSQHAVSCARPALAPRFHPIAAVALSCPWQHRSLAAADRDAKLLTVRRAAIYPETTRRLNLGSHPCA